MDDHDELRAGLTRAAADIDVGDEGVARGGLDAVVHRRRRRNRVVLGAGVVAIIAVGAVVLAVNEDDQGTLVTSDPTTVDVPDDSVDSTVPSAPTSEATSTARAVEVLDRPVTGVPSGPEFAEWIVPWRDGFLAGSTVYPSQPLPESLPEEITALFPQEVRDLFGGELPPTIAEATEMLTEAGLLDEVTAVISENQAASEAIYGAPVTEPTTVDVQFTVDGTTWEPVEMTLPPGATSMYGAVVAGDRLAVAYSDSQSPMVGAAPNTVWVASTTDLIEWTTQEIMLPPTSVELPPGVMRSVNANGLAANGNGWVLTVVDSIDVDIFSLIPEETRAEFETATNNSGFSLSQDDNGVTIVYGTDGYDDSDAAVAGEGSTTVITEPATTNATNSDSTVAGDGPTTIVYTWDELGVSPDVIPYLSSNEYVPQTWAATWDGQPVRSDNPSDFGTLIATSAGFLRWDSALWFSADGISWTSKPLPEPEGYISGGFAVDGGVILISVGEDGAATLYRLDETGGAPEALDVPGLPTTIQAWTSSRSAVLFDGAVQPMPTETLVVEADGYRLEAPPSTGVYRLIDVATGEEVVSDNLRGATSMASSPFQFGPDGITVTDPETGEVIVTIPNAAYEAAMQEIYGGFQEVEYNPEIWLLGSLDGERFVIERVDGEPRSGVAVNNGRALVQAGDRWVTVDLS